MVVILWKLDLQLPMQSVSITTNVVILNPAQTWRSVLLVEETGIHRKPSTCRKSLTKLYRVHLAMNGVETSRRIYKTSLMK